MQVRPYVIGSDHKPMKHRVEAGTLTPNTIIELKFKDIKEPALFSFIKKKTIYISINF